MAEGQEIRATHEEVEGFVAKLRDFHRSLGDSERAMLETVLEGAQGGETGGYALKVKWRYGDPDEQQEGQQRSDTEREGGRGWNDLIGWIEEQGEEDTQGLERFCPKSKTTNGRATFDVHNSVGVEGCPGGLRKSI